MQTRIQKWGNSLALRIPRSFAQEAGVEAGSEVDLSVQDGDLVVRPARRRSYHLSDLLRQVTPENLHAEVETGRRVGKEILVVPAANAPDPGDVVGCSSTHR